MNSMCEACFKCSVCSEKDWMGRLETMISGIECPVIFEVAIRCKEYLGKLRGPRTGIVMQDVPEYKIPKGEI